MKNSTLKAAVIGTGGISGVHLDYLKSRSAEKDGGPASTAPHSAPDSGSRAAVEIAGLCDINPKNLDARLRQYGGRGYTDYEKMLDEVKPDAVWLCTPPQVRLEPLVACAERGIPVFCEKPVARTLVLAGTTAAELRRRKAKVQVGYVFRSMPIVRRLVEETADDRLYLVRSFYGCAMSLNRKGLAPWFFIKELSGGALVDQATHNLDVIRMLMGEVKEVRGVCSNPVYSKTPKYSIDEVLSLSLLFESGAVGSHTHTWVGDDWRNEVDFVGRRAVYRVTFMAGTLTVERGSETFVFRQDKSQIYVYENEAFLKMVASGKWQKNPCTFEEGVASLALVLKCEKTLDS